MQVEEFPVGPSRTIPSHMSEVLYQVEESNLPEGAWVGRDTWFGSATMTVDVYNKFKAWHKKRCLGHSVVMKATIARVDLFACAYT
eukprot:11160931-Ditylum_brightwellii.AAC.1